MANFYFTLMLILCCLLLAERTVEGDAVYTRWGRQICGSIDREIIYTGYVGGSSHDTGSASNYLCLPRSPTFGEKDSTLYARAKIYGTEYLTNGRSDNFPFDLPDEPSLASRNALCAVCLVQNASVALMIPARTDCYPGWTMEYTGYLVAEHDANERKEYVCLDKSPESAPSDGGSEESAHLISVEGVCGSLPCPPYENGWELACVVCTK